MHGKAANCFAFLLFLFILVCKYEADIVLNMDKWAAKCHSAEEIIAGFQLLKAHTEE